MGRCWRWTVGPAMMASAVCTLAAQSAPAAGGGGPWSDACALATGVEFQEIYGINPMIGIIPDDPVLTLTAWGPHCDYADGSIDLFTKKYPSSDLDGLLAQMQGGKQRVPVEGLGKRAFFTTIYPEDKYRRRGLLAVFLGSRVVTFSMDGRDGEPLEATRPKLERLAKLVLPRLE